MALTILITGGLFLIIPLTQVSSRWFTPDQPGETNTVILQPPPKYEPPVPPEIKDKVDDDDIEYQPDIEPVSIRDFDYLFTKPGPGGLLKNVGRFNSDAFTVVDLIYPVEKVDIPPKPLVQVSPSYPPEEKRARLEGKVEVIFLVTDKGQVRDIRIEDATTRNFATSVQNALRRASFEPGKVNGDAVTTRVKQVFKFTLKS